MEYILSFIVIILIFKLYQTLSCGMCNYKGNLIGKVAIVTGANTGIGYETAKDFAERGARVILACRHDQRGIAAQNRIIKETGNINVVYKNLDLASKDSVKLFAEDILRNETHLNILVNNAGAGALGGKFTKDGIIQEMQINHFGPFLLTLLLLPLLKKGKPSRIVNVSSMVHFFGSINFDKINREKSYNGLKMYSNGKLCNVLFTKELGKLLKGTGIVVNALHPGGVNTEIYRETNAFVKILMFVLNTIFFKDAYQGAQTSIYLAVDPKCQNVNGKYFMDCKPSYISLDAADKELAKSLWNYSAKLLDINADEMINKVIGDEFKTE